MSKEKVALSSLVRQAWDQLREGLLEEVKQRIEELAEAERESRMGQPRQARGGSLRRWGYKIRKLFLTPWGLITGWRLPRLRDVATGQEVAFLSSERSEARLAEMLLASTLGGMS